MSGQYVRNAYKRREGTHRYRYGRRAVVLLALFVGLSFAAGCADKAREQQEACLQKGIEALNAGKYDAAVEQFDEGLAHANGTVDAMAVDLCYYKAAAQYCAGNFQEALDIYTALAEFDEDNPAPCYLRGCIYANEREIEQALKDYREAVSRSDEDYELHIEIYEHLNALDARDDALEFLNMALEIKNNDAYGFMQRGRIYLLLEQYDTAEEELKKAVEKGEGEANVYLAQVYESQGEPERAYAVLEEYAKGDDVTSQALNAIGEMELRKGNAQQALQYFERGLSLKDVTNRQELLKNQVAALEYSGDFAQAREKLAQYLQEYPLDGEAQEEMRFLQTR